MIHLASSFQLAGYPHVVGTLWPVTDRRAVKVAESFYSALSVDGAADRNRIATAVHLATRRLRESAPDARLWGAHIHLGP